MCKQEIEQKCNALWKGKNPCHEKGQASFLLNSTATG